MKWVKRLSTLSALLLVALIVSACQFSVPPPVAAQAGGGSAGSEGAAADAQPAAMSLEEKIANAMSAGPSAISQEAAILDRPVGWTGNWPDEPAPEMPELRAGSNGWTCLVDNPDSPGNDPMCMDETFLQMFQARYAKIDGPSTGIGVGYMLQGGAPLGSKPHIMVFAPESREGLSEFGTQSGVVVPWVMYSDTTYEHLMIDLPPLPEAVSAEDKIANAMSAGPPAVAQEARILDRPEGWPGNWPDEPAPELVEIRPGTNGWSCIVDNPHTPGDDPLCVNETFLGVYAGRFAKVDGPSTGIGIGYMLQGGAPAGSLPHVMVFTPGSNEGLTAFTTESGMAPWVMYPDTTYAHLMVFYE